MRKLGIILVIACLLGFSSEIIAEPHVTQFGYNFYATSLRVGSAKRDSTKTDGYAYIDSLLVDYTEIDELSIDSPFIILDGFGSGDHDIVIQAKEDNGSGDVHSFWFDDGNDQWETDEDLYSSSSVGSPLLDGDSTDTDTLECNTLLHGPYALVTELLTVDSEVSNAEPNSYMWIGTVTHDSLTAVALTEDLKILRLTTKYKILEIFVDVTEVFDDGAGPVSACVVSIGWTGAQYDNLIQDEDCFTVVTQIGDAAGELNYTAVQGGIRPNWSSNTDVYIRFENTGGNISTLTSGECIVYLTYQVY